MTATAIVFHPDCRLHHTGGAHPEKIDRLEWIRRRLADAGLDRQVAWLSPEPASRAALEAVHRSAYIDFVDGAWAGGRRVLDAGDTRISQDSARVALLAAGSAMKAVDAVMVGGFRNSFSLARPPGHHACAGEAMGFCIYNNVAVAARHAQHAHGLRRVAVLDWDVHHGNGTQDIFYEDGSVFFVSLHQSPLYPGTGSRSETGRGAGVNATLNVPLPTGSTWAAYQEAWEQEIRPALQAFAPELLLISAGFDAHRSDPIANMLLEAEDFGSFTRLVCEWADGACGGRVVSLLEGGYDPDGMSASAAEHVRELIVAGGS